MMEPAGNTISNEYRQNNKTLGKAGKAGNEGRMNRLGGEGQQGAAQQARVRTKRSGEKNGQTQYRGTKKNRYSSDDYGLTEVSLSRHRQHGNRRP